MASGKQNSFQFGEVSPLERFRDNDAEYSTALYSLYNMHVKRAGGVGKIPGSKHLITPTLINENVPSDEIDFQRFKIFSYPFTDSNGVRQLQRFTLRIKDDLTSIVTIELYDTVINIPTTTNELYYVPNTDGRNGLDHVKAVYAEDRIFIHGLWSLSSTSQVVVVVRDLDTAPVIETLIGDPIPSLGLNVPSTYGTAVLTAGTNLVSGVTYLVMLEYTDGKEEPFTIFNSNTISPGSVDVNGFLVGAGPAYPGDGVITGFSLIITVPAEKAPKLKNVNIYRAPMTNISSNVGGLILAAKLSQNMNWITPPYAGSYFFTISVNDTGASVPSITPPVDNSIFVDRGGSYALEGSSCSCIYQGRHLIGFDGFTNKNIKPGNIASSRLGGISQFARPIIFRDIEAFGLSVPIDDGSPVRQLISAERVVAFTDNGTYVIQGGDNGILTPTTINPIKLSSEGASKNVAPVKLNQNVIYLNSKHTKIMAVFFNNEYKAGALEIGKLSEHLLNGDDFLEMEVLPGADNVIMLLKKSGEIVAITLNDQGAAGFSRINMEGARVESMARFGEPNRECLLLSVIRNGIRSLETIGGNGLADKIRKQSYSNTSVRAGYFLLDPTSQGYPKAPVLADNIINPEQFLTYEYLNITTASDYNAGSELTIVSETELGATELGFSDTVLRVFYSDTEFIHITLTNAGVFAAGEWTYTAQADIDIPEYLQDVENNIDLTAEEKLKRKSRWLKAFKKVECITGLEYETGLGPLYLSLKEGASVNPTVDPDGEVEVNVLGDGAIMSSPLNYQMNTLKIVKEAAGFPYLELPEYVTFVDVGVPYESFMQSLPVETGGDRTITDDKKLITKVGVGLYNTVGGFIGVPDESLDRMAPLVTTNDLDLGGVDKGFTGYKAPIIPSKWTEEGMVKIRHVDPTPINILSIYPKGVAGD